MLLKGEILKKRSCRIHLYFKVYLLLYYMWMLPIRLNQFLLKLYISWSNSQKLSPFCGSVQLNNQLLIRAWMKCK